MALLQVMHSCPTKHYDYFPSSTTITKHINHSVQEVIKTGRDLASWLPGGSLATIKMMLAVNADRVTISGQISTANDCVACTQCCIQQINCITSRGSEMLMNCDVKFVNKSIEQGSLCCMWKDSVVQGHQYITTQGLRAAALFSTVMGCSTNSHCHTSDCPCCYPLAACAFQLTNRKTQLIDQDEGHKSSTAHLLRRC